MPRKKKRSEKLPPSPWPEELAPLPDLFIVDPRNRPLLEGTSRRGKLWREGLIKQIVALTVFLLLLWLGFGAWIVLPEANLSAQFAQEGQTAQARIENRRTALVTSGRGSTSTDYFVSYSFSIPNDTGAYHRYTVEQRVPPYIYERFLEGQAVTIRYLPSDPNQSILADYDRHADMAKETFKGIILISPFAAFIVWMATGEKFFRARALVDRGIWLCGRVEKIQRLTDKPGSSFTVTYSFTAPKDRRFIRQLPQSQRIIQKGSRKRQPLPPPGAPVAIRFVDKDTFEVM